MAGFLSAHGYEPGPTQRPLVAGALGGIVGTAPGIALLLVFGSLKVEARILGVSELKALAIGWPVMALAGAFYARIFGRAANDVRAGWLFGMTFGFALWAGGAALVLPLASGGLALAGRAAIGAFAALVAWGAALGALVPFVHRPLHEDIRKGAERPSVGPDVAGTGGNEKRIRPRARS